MTTLKYRAERTRSNGYSGFSYYNWQLEIICKENNIEPSDIDVVKVKLPEDSYRHGEWDVTVRGEYVGKITSFSTTPWTRIPGTVLRRDLAERVVYQYKAANQEGHFFSRYKDDYKIGAIRSLIQTYNNIKNQDAE